MILDRLYLEDGNKAAMAWIWEHIADLKSPGVLPTAVPVVGYVVGYAAKRFIPDDDGTVSMTTAEDAEFKEKCRQLCERFEITTEEMVDGVAVSGALGDGVLLAGLLKLAAMLLEAWLKQQSA